MTPDRLALEAIYRRPEFVWATIVESVQEWFFGLFASAFAEDSVVPWVAVAVIVAAAGIGVAIWLRGRARRQRTTRGQHDRLPQHAASGLEHTVAEAEKLAAAGDWAAAVRRLLQAFVLLLDETGTLPHDPARTNRELRRALGRTSAFELPLGELVAAAEATAYAGMPGDATLWQQARHAYGQLEQALRSDDTRQGGFDR